MSYGGGGHGPLALPSPHFTDLKGYYVKHELVYLQPGSYILKNCKKFMKFKLLIQGHVLKKS